MHYNFTKTNLKFKDFLDSCASCAASATQDQILAATGFYEKVFTIIDRPFEEEELLVVYEEIAHYKIEHNIPYAIMANEINGLQRLFVSNIRRDVLGEEIIQLLHLFQNISNRVAYIYLMKYVDHLIFINNTRLSSISDLVEKNLIIYYESHLLWLTKLAQRIKASDTTDFPELDDTRCSFGKWLHRDATQFISDKQKYKNLLNIHANLHLLASKIFQILERDEYHILITYLEKCELISLNIGTELALLDNTETTKDSLTGALNRSALRGIFERQYKLSFASSNPFVFAMCDLDFFKKVNDTYGHVTGDKLLIHFVKTLKKNLRKSDIIIRYGGEEFIIVLPTVHKEKGFEILETIRNEFEKSVLEFNEEKISATVSIGMIEIVPKEPFDQKLLDYYLIQADEKLYTAKANGRNRVID